MRSDRPGAQTACRRYGPGQNRMSLILPELSASLDFLRFTGKPPCRKQKYQQPNEAEAEIEVDGPVQDKHAVNRQQLAAAADKQ
ncbi:hypothetical protein VQ056_23525 [Paenibacillus sp. JTLBN-2024]